MSKLREAMFELLKAAKNWPHDAAFVDRHNGRKQHEMVYTVAMERQLAAAIEAAEETLRRDPECPAIVNDDPCLLPSPHRGPHLTEFIDD